MKINNKKFKIGQKVIKKSIGIAKVIDIVKNRCNKKYTYVIESEKTGEKFFANESNLVKFKKYRPKIRTKKIKFDWYCLQIITGGQPKFKLIDIFFSHFYKNYRVISHNLKEIGHYYEGEATMEKLQNGKSFCD